jgi:streptogramin lyase
LLAAGIREFSIPSPNSNPFWITSGPGAQLNFTAGGTSQIGEFDPTTQLFRLFLIPGDFLSSQSTIAAGSDGNLYFPSSSVNALGQFQPSVGFTRSFPVPTASLGTSYITSGPDGNLYFTASSANLIERFDPTTHGFFSFPIPTPNAGAAGITSGPGGSLWFVETTANKIGELNLTTHVITEFPIPIANTGATYITAGPDGNLYFTAPAANDLVQFDPTRRVFTPYPIPTANSGAAALTTGPDGKIYFTEPGSNQIGQFDLSTHVFATYVIPTPNSAPTGITAGPDGNVYFTETAGNKLGEVLLTTGRGTSTQLIVAPNPATVGQTMTLTATVTATAGTPTGTVTFVIDGTAQPGAKLIAHNGVAQATLTTKLPAATHVITAVYRSHGNFAGSVSNAVSLVVFPAPGDGPTVVSLVRLGFHAEPTTLVLTFDKPLDPARAEDRGNYQIVQSHGGRVRVASVRYNPTALTVTISPAQRLDLHRSYRLTVVGRPPSGLTDTSGNLLDGALTGHPGSNYVATIGIRNLRFRRSR